MRYGVLFCPSQPIGRRPVVSMRRARICDVC